MGTQEKKRAYLAFRTTQEVKNKITKLAFDNERSESYYCEKFVIQGLKKIE